MRERGLYLNTVQMTPDMADSFQLEAVRHDSDARAVLEGFVSKSVSCDTPATIGDGRNPNQPHLALQCMVGLNWFQVSSRGVLSSYCFRRVMERLQKKVIAWWFAKHPDNVVIPEEGSLL